MYKFLFILGNRFPSSNFPLKKIRYDFDTLQLEITMTENVIKHILAKVGHVDNNIKT